MSLPAALAVPRVSQTNSPTSLAEPAFYHSALRRELTREFGEKFTLATGPIPRFDHYRGDATGLQVLGSGLCQAVAEPGRLGGGSALAVKSWPVEQVKCAPPPAPREWRENKIAAADKPGGCDNNQGCQP